MRISDWSSDVCSSDLHVVRQTRRDGRTYRRDVDVGPVCWYQISHQAVSDQAVLVYHHGRSRYRIECQERKSVVEGKSVSVRVDLGGRRIIKKKNKTSLYDSIII